MKNTFELKFIEKVYRMPVRRGGKLASDLKQGILSEHYSPTLKLRQLGHHCHFLYEKFIGKPGMET